MKKQNKIEQKLPDKLILLQERRTLSAAKIAKKYGVSRARVYQVLAIAKRRYPDEAVIPEDQFSPKNIARMRKKHTVSEVIAMTGLSRSAVIYRTRKSKVRKEELKKERRTLNDKFLAEIRKKYETKMAKEIAEEYGVAVVTVYGWLKKPCSYERKPKRKQN